MCDWCDRWALSINLVATLGIDLPAFQRFGVMQRLGERKTAIVG
jgi:hypothetical protein